MIKIIDYVLSTLPEKKRFFYELDKRQINLRDVPENLHLFHEVLKSTFGARHYSVECLIIKALHEKTEQGIYDEKDASTVAIQLIDIFTKEHEKEIDATKKALNQTNLLWDAKPN